MTNQRRHAERAVQAAHRRHNLTLSRHEKLPTGRKKLRKLARRAWERLPESVQKEHVEAVRRKGLTDPDAVKLAALAGAE